VSGDRDPADERFEEELRGLFATVRVPPRLAFEDGTARAPRPGRTSRWLPNAGWPRLVAAGIATVLVAGGAAAAVAGGRGTSPDPVASPSPTATGTTARPSTLPPVSPLPDARTTTARSSPPGTGSTGSTAPGTGRSTPPAAGWPGAANTGVPPGTALRPRGDIEVTRPGTVLADLDITGTVSIKAANVTIRNCRIRTTGEWAVLMAPGASVTITDSELTGGHSSAIQEGAWRAYRVHIHDVAGDGVRLGSGALLQDSYIHDVGSAGARMLSGGSNITLRHNVVRGGTSGLFLTPEGGPDGAGPVVVQGNLLGGGDYTLYVVTGQQGRYHQRGYMVTGNRFLRDAQYGAVSVTEPRSAFLGWAQNAFTDGVPVPLP
jgi:hypothetical protein